MSPNYCEIDLQCIRNAYKLNQINRVVTVDSNLTEAEVLCCQFVINQFWEATIEWSFISLFYFIICIRKIASMTSYACKCELSKLGCNISVAQNCLSYKPLCLLHYSLNILAANNISQNIYCRVSHPMKMRKLKFYEVEIIK